MGKLYKWIEEYACGGSTVGRTRAALPGYCPVHGDNRKHAPEKILDPTDKLKTGTAH